MKAHLTDGTIKQLDPLGPTMGLAVERLELDAADMQKLCSNPEALPILYTRFAPPKKADET